MCNRTKTLYVLDTKYKNPKQPSNSDIYQITTYAISQNCDRAILIYPQPLEVAIDRDIGNNINLRTLTFSLEDNLEIAGRAFLHNL